MGQHHLPGADDFGRAGLGARGGLEIPAGRHAADPQALDALYALGARIRASSRPAELDEIEREIDRVLLAQRKIEAFGEQEARDVVAVNVAAHRLENLIHDRRLFLAAQQEGKLREQARG